MCVYTVKLYLHISTPPPISITLFGSQMITHYNNTLTY